MIRFNGTMDTGLTLRTIRLKDGVAEVRAGATLLWDSDPEAEEAETRLKASAFLDAITAAQHTVGQSKASAATPKLTAQTSVPRLHAFGGAHPAPAAALPAGP